ncbi:helix-turn-helix transcriptional regulator [Paenibacillus sp. FSL P4-0502]|uniref:helix-turn-helix transcriptional regulator n=1 Tax=Paenibacillus sp. FSL P4-0502 TaxID=2975319 RepID=UPI0030F8A20A
MTSSSIHNIYNGYFDALFEAPSMRDTTERKHFAQSSTQGYVDRVITPSGIEIVDSDYRFADDRLVQVQSEAAMIELSFCLQGSGEVHVTDTSHELMPDSCSLQFMQDFQAEFHYRSAEPIRLLSIGVPVTLFDSWMEDQGSSHARSLSGLLDSRAFRMFRMPILPETNRLLVQLRDCPYHTSMRRLYVEGKALELLSVYFDVFLFEQKHIKRSLHLSRSDRENIRKARDIILDHMANPPSLIELSKLAGINEYKLKVGFKEEYGTTVFAYLRNKRLEKAWEIISTGDISVSQTATMVGYNNFSHFAEAFRKQYGINPSEVIKKR